MEPASVDDDEDTEDIVEQTAASDVAGVESHCQEHGFVMSANHSSRCNNAVVVFLLTIHCAFLGTKLLTTPSTESL